MALRRRRWFTFSLRSVLVLTTLICVWLGREVNQAVRQQQAVELLGKLDADYLFAHQTSESLEAPADWSDLQYPPYPDLEVPPAPEWLLRTIGEDHFRQLAYVGLDTYDPRTTAAALRAIASLRGIVRVDIDGELTPEHIRQLASLPGLRTLSRWDCELELSPATLAELPALTRLESLALGQYAGNPGPWLSKLPRLQVLDLSYTGIDDEGVRSLATLSRLRFLNLQGTQVKGSGLTALSACPLERLDFSDCALEADELSGLSDLVSLRELAIGGSDGGKLIKVSESELAFVAQLANLESLDLSGSDITPAGAELLAQLPKLSRLRLTIASALRVLPQLVAICNLKDLELDGWDAQAASTLGSALPSCKLWNMTGGSHF